MPGYTREEVEAQVRAMPDAVNRFNALEARLNALTARAAGIPGAPARVEVLADAVSRVRNTLAGLLQIMRRAADDAVRTGRLTPQDAEASGLQGFPLLVLAVVVVTAIAVTIMGVSGLHAWFELRARMPSELAEAERIAAETQAYLDSLAAGTSPPPQPVTSASRPASIADAVVPAALILGSVFLLLAIRRR